MANIRVLLQAFVVLISYALCAGDDCPVTRNIQCYECSTVKGDKFCADPFNASHPGAKYENCEGACAKWVRIPKKGPVHYIRTCSAKLNMQMHVSLVCMKESRPGDGRLCFCKSKKCNGATRPSADNIVLVAALLIAFLTIVFCSSQKLEQNTIHVDNTSKYCAQNRRKKLPSTIYETVDNCVRPVIGLELAAQEEASDSAPRLEIISAGLGPVPSGLTPKVSLPHALYNEDHNGVTENDPHPAILDSNTKDSVRYAILHDIKAPEELLCSLKTRRPNLWNKSKSSLKTRTPQNGL